MSPEIPTVHASAVLVGSRAVLIRGPSGAGKSRLALALLRGHPSPSFARLVGDDRVHLEPMYGRLLVRPAPALAGLIEVREMGILRLPFEPVAVVGFVVDLASPEAERLPDDPNAVIAGIRLPRLAVAAGTDPLRLVPEWLREPQAAPHERLSKPSRMG